MASEAKPIAAAPADKQIIEHDGKRYTTVKEGLAHILVPDSAVDDASKKSKGGDQVQQVFYNPIQQFNRDLTVLALKAYGKEKLESKRATNKSKTDMIAEKKKKRKRQDQGQEANGDNRPEKMQKLAEGAGKTADDKGGADGAAVGEAHPEAEPRDQEDAVMTEAGDETPAVQIVTEPEGDQENTRTKQEEAQQPNGQAKPDKPPSTGPKFTILDALSASGLRALRYAHEIPFVTSVTANDLMKSAVASIQLNVDHNKLQDKIKASHDNAIAHMYNIVIQELRKGSDSKNKGKPGKSEKYDVVDLDPYGTAAPFLDAAVQAVRDDGGLLCVTCTDSGVWASNGYPEKCYSLYGGVPVKGWFSHEVGIRLILHAIESAAARYGLAIEPLLSLSIDFYIRVFVRIRRSPASVKFQGGKNMMVYNCDNGCGAWATQLLMRNKAATNKNGSGIFYKHVFAAGPPVDRHCEHCGSVMHMAGPMYAGRIHSPSFITRVLDEVAEASPEVYGTKARVEGMLQTALEELLPSREELDAESKSQETQGETGSEKRPKQGQVSESDLVAIEPYPFYIHAPQLAGVLHTVTPPEAKLRGALIGLGYRVTRSHTKAGSLKTDAPWSVIWHVMREWVRQESPVREEKIKPGSAGYRILGLDKKKVASQNGELKDPGTATPAEGQGESEDGATKKKLPEVVFDEALGRDPEKNKVLRYQKNPRENWGPMARARGK